MSTVYKYKIYCTTEEKYVEGWGTTAPTVCYNNNTHTVNSNSVQTIDTIASDAVSIKEDKVQVARNVKIEFIEFKNVESNSTQTVEYKFDIVTSMYSFQFMADDTNKGDELTIAGVDTTMGLIAASLSPGATTLYAPPALLAYGTQGFYLKLTDGTNTDELGYILSIDKIAGTVTFQNATTHSFSSSNTLVKMTYYIMKSVKIGPPATYMFCDDVVGGTAVPLNTVVKFIYKNNSMPGDLTDEPKSLIVYLTLLF